MSNCRLCGTVFRTCDDPSRSQATQPDYPNPFLPTPIRLPMPTHPVSLPTTRTNSSRIVPTTLSSPYQPRLPLPYPSQPTPHFRPPAPGLPSPFPPDHPDRDAPSQHNSTCLALPVLFRPNPTALVMTLPVRPKPTTLPVSDQSVPTTLSSPIHPTLTSLTMLRLTRPAPTTPYSPIPTFSTCRTANHPYHFDSPHRNLTLQNSPDLPTLVASAQTTTQPLPCLTSSFRI